jgi:dipeptidyl aminopeptidase/acylaminoacyl peptidase
MLAGSWSPDGKQILFDTAIDGNHDVYVISADGGDAVRLTTNPLLDLLADWSKDGRWIYYAAESSGPAPGSNIWRVPAQGGFPEQITTEGGFDPQISPDGRYLYYLDRTPLAGKGRLLRMTISSGQTKFILAEVTPFLWCVADEGIYFVRGEAPAYSIHLYRFEDEKITRTGILRLRIAGLQAPGRLTVSRDGRWALANAREAPEGDLMLLEDFR